MSSIKKRLLGSLLAASLLFSAMPHFITANENNLSPIDGVISEGRILVPVRHVSAYLGADVTWQPAGKLVTIRHGETELRLRIGSTQVTRKGESLTLDVPAQIRQGVTFVPIRFVSQGLNAAIDYNAETRSASILWQGARIPVITPNSFNRSELTEARINALVAKANEATRLSDYKQVRTHFRPYFTDAYINKLLIQGGPGNEYRFTEQPHTYSLGTEGSITQFSYASLDSGPLERRLTLLHTEDGWKVNDISFSVLYP
ncbi:copper amine oxidase N-terminal domain-containing protein [Paenibacillus daejeonensis]|uniref:copper amine oxidase N-terminal domain-containing protein n=1 Tax=Paenibacillus daejeonensis TaxID=135193 RepID=UPI00035E7DE1|nr:copper amine oxidase N-terminal domain-containing protein [Paenibacillus daejeonensis]